MSTIVNYDKTLIFYDNINKWLENPNSSFFKANNGVQSTLMRYQISQETKISKEEPGDIILIQQFYLPQNNERKYEIQQCLKYNNHNKQINKIVLLNEKLYSDKELGISSSKIQQINITNRLTYKDVFKFVETLGEDKYIILSNIDIFFDNSIKQLRFSEMIEKKKLFSLLRYEYKGENNLKECNIFGPRPDSQDTWIWHSKWKIPQNYLNMFDIKLGVPGCDNKIIYILNILGFSCYNEPELIKSYHMHNSNVRSYDNNTKKIESPYYAIFPILSNKPKANELQTFDIIRENNVLYNYLNNKFKENKQILIPRIAGIENELAMMGILIQQGEKININDVMSKIAPVMKNNAGIYLQDINSIVNYSNEYMSAFKKCERYAWWEPWGNVVRWIPRSFDFIIENFNKPKIDALVFDIFHNIYNTPWTLALRGKKILIISSFIESIKEKIPIREKIYGIDLFPDCEFVFLKPPQTHGSNDARKFEEEFKDFKQNIEAIKDSFDIALCSCGGYGNPICSAIFDIGKSAIYVGGVLQMYFGIFGQRWLRERPDIMRMYLNKHWSRPKNSERPKNHNNVEKSSYW